VSIDRATGEPPVAPALEASAAAPAETVGVRPILHPGRNCWVVAEAADSGVLIDGEEYYRAFHDAARAARHYILLAGWQFDSGVTLLRGEQRTGDGEVRLLPFLRELCEANPELQVRILCWDYSPAFFFQREWLQDVRFNAAHPNIVFRFDDRHPIGGSHHQKFAVIDDAVAFVGSMDLCHERWDERAHRYQCDGRCEPSGTDTYGPYHEVQAFVTGPAVRELRELFAARWRTAGAGPLDVRAPDAPRAIAVHPTVPLGPARVAFSRTAPRILVPDQPEIREIERLFVDAIDAAEHLVYLESQYFGARALLAAFVRRLRQADRPPLEIVLVCPRALHSFSERMSIAGPQAIMFDRLRRLGAAHGHSVGIYCLAICGDDDGERDIYIHSKLGIVDDRFLTVGSANLNNRSMGLDTELNVSWESGLRDARLHRAVRRVRVSLLAEHAGRKGLAAIRRLTRARGLVAELDRIAAEPGARLRAYPAVEVPPAPAYDLPEDSGWDPDQPIEAVVFERIFPNKRDVLRAGLGRVRSRFRAWRARRRVAVNPPLRVARRPTLWWVAAVRLLRRFGLPLAVLAVVVGLAWWLISWLVRVL